MDRRTRNLFATALIAVIVAAGAAILVGGSRADPDGSASAPSVVGVIVGVKSEGLDSVRSFNLRAQDGTTVEFVVGDLENGDAFPPGHLVEHQATAQRIRVWFRTDGATRIAIRLEDAP